MSKELSSVLATRRVSAASRLTPRLILPDLTITAVLAASLILASSAALKPVVPMMCTLPALAASAAKATVADRRGEIDDAVGLVEQRRRVAGELDAVLRHAGERAGIPADQRRARVFQRAGERKALGCRQSP